MERVYAYIRVSTEGQVKNGYSIEEQKAEVIKYCNEKGYELVKIFEDRGISGATANEEEMSIEGRDGLMDMLGALKDNNIKYIVVLTTSRLWRSDLVKFIIHRELKRYNVDVKAIDRPNYSIYSVNPNDVLINGIFEVLDKYERVEIELKLRRGRIQKAKSKGGYAGGGAPYGYKAVRGSKVLNIDDKESEAVRRVYELREFCPWLTLKEIAETLQVEGYKARKGEFNPMLVKRILDKEKFYKGYYKYGDIETNDGEHEAIL